MRTLPIAAALLPIALLATQGCIWILGDEPIQAGGSGAGGETVGGQPVGAGPSGGIGGGNGGGLPVCMEPCIEDSGACVTPSNKIFLEPTETINPNNDPDRVLPIGLAVSGNDVYGAVRYRPAITGGPGVPLSVAADWVARLNGDSAEGLIKIHECGLPNADFSTGPIAGGPEKLHAIVSSAASASGTATVSSTTSLLGDSCEPNAQTTQIVTADSVNGLTPFVFTFGTDDPIEDFNFVTNDIPGQQVAMIDIDSNPGGDTAFLAVGPSDAFAVAKPVARNVAYSVGRLTPAGGIQWFNFVDLEATGTFPGTTFEGGISVDEAGGVWVVGTTGNEPNTTAFVQYRAPDGDVGLTWLGQPGSRGKTIAVADGQVIVGLDITLPYIVSAGTITPAGGRDFLIVHFDAQTFITERTTPTWYYPDTEAAHQTVDDDVVKQVEISVQAGCATNMYVLACIGVDCDTPVAAAPLLILFDPLTGSFMSTRNLTITSGSLTPSQLAIVPDGVWIGAELKGSAYGRESKAFDNGTLAGSTWFLKLPR